MNDRELKLETRYWVAFGILFLMAFVFNGADPCSSADQNLGLCEYNSTLSTLMAISCLGSLVPLGLALSLRNKKGGSSGKRGSARTVIVRNTPTQRIVRTTRQFGNGMMHGLRGQQPQAPTMPSQMQTPVAAEKSNVADQRKQAHLDRAYKMEIEGDLEGAITAYELAEEFKEAQRIKWALGGPKKGSEKNGPANVNISIGKVGDTSIQDSVVTGSEEEV